MSLRSLLFVLALMLATASQTVFAQAASESAQQIASARDEWVRNWNAKNLEGLLTLYAQDAVLLPPTGGKLISGRDGIRAYLKGLIDSFVVDLSFSSTATESFRDSAFDRGTLRCGLTVASGTFNLGGHQVVVGGPPRRAEGDYITVLKRQTSGKWLIVQQSVTINSVGPSTSQIATP